MSKAFYLYSGMLSIAYSIYAGLNYYTLSSPLLISNEIAKKKLINKEITHVIDVRTKMEWEIGHYPGAIHIPITKLSKKKLKNISKNSTILVYCNTGQRARMGAEYIINQGYSNVYYIASTYNKIL